MSNEQISDQVYRVPTNGLAVQIKCTLFLRREKRLSPKGDLKSYLKRVEMTGTLENRKGKIVFLSGGEEYNGGTRIANIKRIHMTSETTPEMAS